MGKGNILTNARSFARQMCSAYSAPAVPGNQLLPPPPSPRPQTTASIKQRGDGSSLAHIWQETPLSKGKAGVQSDLTISFCRAGGGTCINSSISDQPGHTQGGAHLSLETDTLDALMSERSLQWTLSKVPDLSPETERGCMHKCTLGTHHFGHNAKSSKGHRCLDWVSMCKGYNRQLLPQKIRSSYGKTLLHSTDFSPEKIHPARRMGQVSWRK